MAKLTEEERHEKDDFFARRRDFIVQLYEGNRQHKIEFYKQIMILSVAGLGFDLSPPIRRNNILDWGIPANAWEWSVWGFLAAIFGTLALFFLHSWFDSLRGELIVPDIESRASAGFVVALLRIIINVLAVASTLCFTGAVIAAIMFPST